MELAYKQNGQSMGSNRMIIKFNISVLAPHHGCETTCIDINEEISLSPMRYKYRALSRVSVFIIAISVRKDNSFSPLFPAHEIAYPLHITCLSCYYLHS